MVNYTQVIKKRLYNYIRDEVIKMLEDVKDEIIKDYNLFLEEEHLENNQDSIDAYITCQYYDIADALEELQEYYPIMQDLTYEHQIKFIENKIESIIKGE